jgi:hypothetical protein
MLYNTLMRIAKTVCITLPPDLLKKAQKTAAREHRTMSELFREALRHYLAEGVSRKESSAEIEQSAGARTGEGDRSSNVLHSFRMEKPVK